MHRIATLDLSGNWFAAVGLAAVVYLAYSFAIWYPGFGPELAMFFTINAGRSLTETLSVYAGFDGLWYRPTSFHLLYWLGGHLFEWNNIAAWKALHLFCLVAACWTQYLFTREFLGGAKLAAWFAAIYLAVFPGEVSIVLQTSAFDATHIVFSLLTAILFSRALKSTGTRKWWLAIASCLSYAAALTCKEITLVLPLFLMALLWLRGPRRDWPILVPHFLLMGAYTLLHVVQLPTQGRDQPYRTVINMGIILRNLWSYPLWIARIFGASGHPAQSLGYDSFINNIAGVALLAATVRYWVIERSQRLRCLSMLAWIAVACIIPVYSGSFLWHVNLAVCGYAVLAGAALASLTRQLADRLAWRPVVAAAGVTIVLLALGAYAVVNTLFEGVHSTQYQLIAGLMRDTSRLPAVVSKDTLIYVEDRGQMGKWTYGGGDHLLKFYYQNPKLEEKSVPSIEAVPWELRYEWLRKRNALFIRYDDRFRWYDGSKDFRLASFAGMSGYTSRLIDEGKYLHIVGLLDAAFREPEPRNNFLLHYHYAFALHNLGRTRDAIAAYTRSIDLEPAYYFTRMNRGNAYRQTGNLAAACDDYRAAAAAEGGSIHGPEMLKTYCR